MAEKIEVVFDVSVHESFRHLLQRISDQHGIQVVAVQAEWLDTSSVGTRSMTVTATHIRSSMVPHPDD